MENNLENQFANDLAPLPEKPQFLKILCILSFISCGLWILIFAIGTLLLGFKEDTIMGVWDKVIQTQPQLESLNPVEFFHEAGLVCLYSLLANIVSLVGVILMWRLNKIGFVIYVVAEIAANFFSINISGSEAGRSYGGMIFMIIIDLVFIVMYAVNLKYMNKKNDSVTAQV